MVYEIVENERRLTLSKIRHKFKEIESSLAANHHDRKAFMLVFPELLLNNLYRWSGNTYMKKYTPIALSVIIVIIGIATYTLIYENWASQVATVSNSGINIVKTDNQTRDLKTIIHDAEKNVMQIEGQMDNTTMTGSGFLYNDKGDIITNSHVVKDADAIYVRTADARIYPAAIVGIGDDTDIAVIRVPQLAGQASLPVDEETKAEIGDEVIALGSPHGFQNTVTLGIISGTERNFTVEGFNYENVYQISAQITNGNSGGPLIKRETGKIIGINSVGTEDGTIGFSIPITEVIDQAKKWSNEAKTDQLDFAKTNDIVSTSASESFQDDAEYLIKYFLENILIRDYVGAYSLLASNMQSEMSYTDFRDEYIDIVDLDFSGFSSDLTESNQNKTTVDITIETKQQNEEKTIKETYQYIFTTGYENDQIKIQRMELKKSK